MLRSSELIIRFVKLGCEGQQACATSQKFDQVVHGSALELSGKKSTSAHLFRAHLSVSAEQISSSHSGSVQKCTHCGRAHFLFLIAWTLRPGPR